MNYAEWQQDGFCGFFGVKETGRAVQANNRTQIHLKPGAYQNFIDLQIETLDTDEMVSATLQVDRSWLIPPAGLNMLGVDIVKSFIDAGLTDAARPTVEPLVSAIWGLGSKEKTLQLFQRNAAALEPGLLETLPSRLPGLSMVMITKAEENPSIPILQPEILYILLTYYGIRDSAALSVPPWSLTASNQPLDGALWFRLVINFQA